MKGRIEHESFRGKFPELFVGEVGSTGLLVNTLGASLKLLCRHSRTGTSTRGWGGTRNL